MTFIIALTDNKNVTCSRQVILVADCSISNVQDKIFDVVVLPGGGKGAENLASDSQVGEILKKHDSEGKILAAVCAAPTAFQSHDIGKGKNITSYPAFKEKLAGDYR